MKVLDTIVFIAAYNRDLDNSGLSGDDVNRRLREGRLGHSAPSSDWEDNKGKVIRCIWTGQIMRRVDTLHNYHFYNAPMGWELN